MKLQQATRCALFAVLDLAQAPGHHRSAQEIAVQYGFSVNHLLKVLKTLVQAGLLESVRGAGGGYRFIGNPKRVTLLDIIRRFESVEVVGSNGANDGSTALGTTLQKVLLEIDATAVATLSSITISTFLKLSQRT